MFLIHVYLKSVPDIQVYNKIQSPREGAKLIQQ